jgi:glycopeptide antibiotics resistance protein
MKTGRALFVAYLAVLLWLVLFKFSIHPTAVLNEHSRSLNLVPFAGADKLARSEMIYNVLAFVPLGVLLSANVKRATFGQKFACVLAVSVAVETIQWVFAIGASDITDVITNTFGGLMGLLIYFAANRNVATEKLDRFIGIAGSALLVLFIVALAVLLTHARFQTSPKNGQHLHGVATGVPGSRP